MQLDVKLELNKNLKLKVGLSPSKKKAFLFASVIALQK